MLYTNRTYTLKKPLPFLPGIPLGSSIRIHNITSENPDKNREPFRTYTFHTTKRDLHVPLRLEPIATWTSPATLEHDRPTRVRLSVEEAIRIFKERLYETTKTHTWKKDGWTDVPLTKGNRSILLSQSELRFEPARHQKKYTLLDIDAEREPQHRYLGEDLPTAPNAKNNNTFETRFKKIPWNLTPDETARAFNETDAVELLENLTTPTYEFHQGDIVIALDQDETSTDTHLTRTVTLWPVGSTKPVTLQLEKTLRWNVTTTDGTVIDITDALHREE